MKSVTNILSTLKEEISYMHLKMGSRNGSFIEIFSAKDKREKIVPAIVRAIDEAEDQKTIKQILDIMNKQDCMHTGGFFHGIKMKKNGTPQYPQYIFDAGEIKPHYGATTEVTYLLTHYLIEKIKFIKKEISSVNTVRHGLLIHLKSHYQEAYKKLTVGSPPVKHLVSFSSI